MIAKEKNNPSVVVNPPHIRIQHIPAIPITPKKCDQSPVIIEYCFNNETVSITTTKSNTSPSYSTSSSSTQNNHHHQNHHQQHNHPAMATMFVHGRKKLDKDDKSIIEELATTNAEYKKVNSFLSDEIELLKRENDLLKFELIKVHMSDSGVCNQLTNSGSAAHSEAEEEGGCCIGGSSTCISTENSASTPMNKSSMRNIEVALRSKFLNCSTSSINNNSMVYTVPCFNMTSNNNNTTNQEKKHRNSNSSSSGNSSASSSSWSISATASSIIHGTNSSHGIVDSNVNNNKIQEFKSIDLSKYIDDDDDDNEDDEDEFYDQYDYDNNNNINNHSMYTNNSNSSENGSINHPPLEFTYN